MRDLALYDRDINFSGEIAEDTILRPEYGSSMSFRFYSDSFYTQDNHRKRVSRGFNDLEINLDLVYTNKKPAEAEAFVAVMEHISTGFFVDESGDGALLDLNRKYYPSGSKFVELHFPTGTGSTVTGRRDFQIYKGLSGLSVMDYSVKQEKGLFNLGLSLKTNRESPLRNWSGSAFLNETTKMQILSSAKSSEVAPHWGSLDDTDKSGIRRFDIVHWTGVVYNEDRNMSDESQNFYFAVKDFNTGASNDLNMDPSTHVRTLAPALRLWSKEFSEIFIPDDGVTFNQREKLNHLKFRNSVLESQNLQKNKNLIETLTLNFTNRSDRETKALLFFLEKKGSRVPFKINLPEVYKRDKYFLVSNFAHTFVYEDVNDITVTVEEIVSYRHFIDSPMGFRIATEDGKPLLSQKYTGSVPIPADQDKLDLVGYGTTGLDQVFDPKFLTLEAQRNIREVSGVQYTEAITGGITGALTFELRWNNYLDVLYPDYGKSYLSADGGPDLDLNVIEPNGRLINRFTTSVYEANPGFHNDVRGVWGSGTTTGNWEKGTETIYYRQEPPEGTYTVFPTVFNNIGQNQELLDFSESLQYEAYVESAYTGLYRRWANDFLTLTPEDTGPNINNNANVVSYYQASTYIIDIKRSGVLESSNTGVFYYNHYTLAVAQTAADPDPPTYHASIGTTGMKFYITI